MNKKTEKVKGRIDEMGTKATQEHEPSPAEYCFGCGQMNPHGLRLKVERKGDSWESLFVPQPYHCGWPGITHGGVLSTALDEVMSYIAYGKGLTAVTARLSIEFKHPCPEGKPLLIRARPVKISRRIIDAEAEILLEDGTVAVKGQAKFMIVPTAGA